MKSGPVVYSRGIRNDLATLDRRAVTVTHVWHEGESTDVLEESLIQVWSTTSGEGPDCRLRA